MVLFQFSTWELVGLGAALLLSLVLLHLIEMREWRGGKR
jgi:hypothetical protein